MPTTKSTLFVVNKDEWDTKEGYDKSIAIVELRESEGTVSQSVENSVATF